jgi:hypothetical protein
MRTGRLSSRSWIYYQKPDQNAIPTLRDAKEVMRRLAIKNKKTVLAIEADRTVHDESEGAVAGEDDDDDQEISSDPIAKSAAGAKVQQRDKSTPLKYVKPTYGNRLASIISTFRAWKVFRDSLGSDVMDKYEGTYGENEVGLNAALAANQKVQDNKTKNDLQAIPTYEPIKSYLPKIKAKLGADSLFYLAALLQTKLLRLRDNLGGIKIRTDDEGLHDRTIEKSSRNDWYNRRAGRLYISHFKTNKSRIGTPYDFN